MLSMSKSYVVNWFPKRLQDLLKTIIYYNATTEKSKQNQFTSNIKLQMYFV